MYTIAVLTKIRELVLSFFYRISFTMGYKIRFLHARTRARVLEAIKKDELPHDNSSYHIKVKRS